MVTVYGPSPVDSMRLAVLTVSPNKQYRGILLPTMPATTGPVCAPLRICRRSPGRFGTWKTDEAANRSNAIVAISDTCLSPVGSVQYNNITCCSFYKIKKKVVPFLTGRPEATI